MSLLSKAMGWDDRDDDVWPVVPEIKGGGVLNVPGALMNAIYKGYHNLVNPKSNDDKEATSNVPDPNTFGDITQNAPGSWIRSQQGLGTARATTFLTRGTSAGKIKARQTASGSTGY